MKTVVACPLEGPTFESIKHWLQSRHVDEGPVDFVHIVKRVVYAEDIMVVREYPTPEQFSVMKESFSEFIRKELFACLPQEVRGVSQVHIMIALDESEEMVEYLKKNKANLLVVGTRGLKGFQGLFTSSFATKMMKEAPCNLLVLRP